MAAGDIIKANKLAQLAESAQRGTDASNDAALNAAALAVDGDTADVGGGDTDTGAVAAPAPEERRGPTVKAPSDDIRNAITKSWRESRNQDMDDAADDAAELRRMAGNGLPPEFNDIIDAGGEGEGGDAPPPPAETQVKVEPTQAAPQRKKVIIRGEERFLTDDELIAAAQRGLAGDTYFDDSKRTLEEARALRAQVEAMQAGLTTKHPGGQNSPQNGGTEGQTTGDGAHPAEDPFEKVVESLQYGDPKDAAAQLRELVSRVVPTASREEIVRSRRQDEHTRSLSVLKTFQDSNPDLASDPMSQAAMRAALFDLQREDLVKAGLDPAKIPADPNVMATIHLHMRADGAPVRSVPDLLKGAKESFEKWRGPKAAQSEDTSQQTTDRQAGDTRVRVDVNRTDRRAAIPQQPTRTAVAPQRQQQQPQPRDRSDVVANMRANRMRARNGGTA